jgi:hypothetical protein
MMLLQTAEQSKAKRRGWWAVRRKNYFAFLQLLVFQISIAEKPKAIYDLTFLVHCIIVEIRPKIIIESRNT